MPQAQAGAVISNSGQIGDGVIVDADINASAAIAHSKMESDARARANHTGTQAASTISDFAARVGDSTKTLTNTTIDADGTGNSINNIRDADINASAAIADTKLATISTASKVDGAALTGLANIPAGAGVLPSANSPGATDSQIKTDTVTLSSTDIGNLFTTPKVLVAAPGAGKILVFDSVVIFFDVGGTQYIGGGDIRIEYTGDNTNLMQVAAGAATFTGAADVIRREQGVVDIAISAFVNTGIEMLNASAAFTLGNGTAKVFITYRIITL